MSIIPTVHVTLKRAQADVFVMNEQKELLSSVDLSPEKRQEITALAQQHMAEATFQQAAVGGLIKKSPGQLQGVSQLIICKVSHLQTFSSGDGLVFETRNPKREYKVYASDTRGRPIQGDALTLEEKIAVTEYAREVVYKNPSVPHGSIAVENMGRIQNLEIIQYGEKRASSPPPLTPP